MRFDSHHIHLESFPVRGDLHEARQPLAEVVPVEAPALSPAPAPSAPFSCVLYTSCGAPWECEK